ncbi:unnamed protein product [Linum tenue]|uniref:Secreted protein n=1 Tax=Linum tenue TaxID=586396 RepID=A0AAV0PM57_9ROSI|nr:unnamed protein product [Linum tenue]
MVMVVSCGRAWLPVCHLQELINTVLVGLGGWRARSHACFCHPISTCHLPFLILNLCASFRLQNLECCHSRSSSSTMALEVKGLPAAIHSNIVFKFRTWAPTTCTLQACGG